jgi:hypothetical protein
MRPVILLGTEGRRSALDRLKSHPTLQKILADVVHKMPDDEILLLTFEYLPYRVITSMDGTNKKAGTLQGLAASFADGSPIAHEGFRDALNYRCR